MLMRSSRLDAEKARLEHQIFVSSPSATTLDAMGQGMKGIVNELASAPRVSADAIGTMKAQLEVIFGSLKEMASQVRLGSAHPHDDRERSGSRKRTSSAPPSPGTKDEHADESMLNGHFRVSGSKSPQHFARGPPLPSKDEPQLSE